MKRIAIYSRKSVYIEGSISIETQINMCKEYMLKNLKIVNLKYLKMKVLAVVILIDQPFKKCLN